MPLVRIDVIEGRSDAELTTLADAVQDVMLDVFAAPPGDRYQVIHEHRRGRIIAEDTGLGLARTDAIVVIQVTEQGRDETQKKALYAALARVLEDRTGLRPEDLIVSIVENTPADWSFGLGRAQFLEGDLWKQRLAVRQVGLAHPDAVDLIERVQQVYVARYGGRDDDPLDPAEFAAPNGGFYVGYLEGRPVASGAWRRSAHAALGSSETAEVKRMYVVEEARRRGIARSVLTHLEREVARAGIAVITLGTGSRQPEALALYREAGYVPIAGFGHYAASTSSHFLGKRLIGD